MRTNILRHVAVALGLSVCFTQAHAADYTAPAKWDNFNKSKSPVFKTVGTGAYCPTNPVGYGNAGGYSVVAPQAGGYAVGGGHVGGYGVPAGQAGGYTVGGGQMGGYGVNGAVQGYQSVAPGYQAQSQSILNGAANHGGSVAGNASAAAAGSTQVAPAAQQRAAQQQAVAGAAAQYSQGAATQYTQGATMGSVISDKVIAESAPQVVGQYVHPAPAVQAPATVYQQAAPVYQSAPIYQSAPVAYAPAQPSYGYIQRAVNRGPGRIAPWFGGFNLMFLAVNQNEDRILVVDDVFNGKQLALDDLTPRDRLGFDVHAGRYLANGLYGLDFGYFMFDPGAVQQDITAAIAGDYRAAMPQWDNLNLDPGTGLDTVYNHFDGAAAFRATRDMSFQSVEANLVSFGWMGGNRRGYGACGGIGDGLGLGHRLGLNRPNCCYGGAGGPLTRCGNRVQISTSHGFRWFQFKDSFELAGDINGAAGYQFDDVYYNVDVENDLFGYQFGGRLSYCLSPRLQLNIGGKFGLYGNDVEYRQRLGTDAALAYVTASGVDDVHTTDSDTVFSALGELDLGLGYRFSNAWTIQGGYRMIAASGVATAPGNISNEFTSLASSAAVRADDSVVLHGGYFGLQYNW